VCQVGRRLVQAQPRELVVGNIVRRVLGLIRDEAVENRAAELATPAPITPFTPAFTRQNSAAHYFSNARAHALHARLPTPARPTPAKANSSYYQGGPGSFRNGAPGGSVQGDVEALRSEIIDGIEEIKDEIEQVDDQIASFAIVHIIPGDYVLVHRPSTAIRRFLSKAATRRKFTVLIITNAWQDPSSEVSNKTMRKELGNAGIPSINIMSSGVTAYMPRVKKVILAARAVLAGGDAVVDAGAGTIARAAKRQGAVVTVLAGVYKLSPGKGCQDGLVEWGEPSRHDDFADGSMVDGIKVMTAVTEVVSAASIDVYISNL
jgi:translation initiation factor eIF-2B subunit beta